MAKIPEENDSLCVSYKGLEVEAPHRRPKVTVERVALVVVSVLLLAAVCAVIGLTLYCRSSKNKSEAMREAVAVLGKIEVTTSPNIVLQCDTNWQLNGTQCYYFSPGSLKLNWTDSRDKCQSFSGDLVKIESREEQDFLDGKARKLMDSKSDQFWIGLTDVQTEGQWLWTDGSLLDENLAFWTKNIHNSEPDNWRVQDPDGEHCAQMGETWLINGLKSWYDTSCKNKKRFICEKSATRSASCG